MGDVHLPGLECTGNVSQCYIYVDLHCIERYRAEGVDLLEFFDACNGDNFLTFGFCWSPAAAPSHMLSYVVVLRLMTKLVPPQLVRSDLEMAVSSA
jgi:hypothetical protein